MNLNHTYLPTPPKFDFLTLQSIDSWNFQMLEWRAVVFIYPFCFFFPFPFLPPSFVNIWRPTTALYDDYLEERMSPTNST